MPDTSFYLVSEAYLPKALRLTAKAKELLSSGEAGDIDSAAEAVGISRSTFYKYRDGVFSFYDLGTDGVAHLSLRLQDHAGVLSGVLKAVAESGANVLAINQGLPSQEGAVVTMSVGMGGARVRLGELTRALERLDGVSNVRVEGMQR